MPTDGSAPANWLAFLVMGDENAITTETEDHLRRQHRAGVLHKMTAEELMRQSLMLIRRAAAMSDSVGPFAKAVSLDLNGGLSISTEGPIDGPVVIL